MFRQSSTHVLLDVILKENSWSGLLEEHQFSDMSEDGLDEEDPPSEEVDDSDLSEEYLDGPLSIPANGLTLNIKNKVKSKSRTATPKQLLRMPLEEDNTSEDDAESEEEAESDKDSESEEESLDIDEESSDLDDEFGDGLANDNDKPAKSIGKPGFQQ